MRPNARFGGKRRLAGFLIIVAVSISIVGVSAAMLTHFAASHKEVKPDATLVPYQSKIARLSGTVLPTSTAHSASSTVTPTNTTLPVSTTATSMNTAPPVSSTATPTNTATPHPTVAASPLLFGTNPVLQNGSDQVLTSSITQSLLQQIHVGIVRIPVRIGVPEAVIVQAAQTAKRLGAMPIVILHSMQDPQALSDDTLIITDMNHVFGTGMVYYEFGNEDDFSGVSTTTYTAAWNTIIPALKRVALNGQFIGPVTYHYDPIYLSYFLGHAVPLPDAMSWHEYACWSSDTTDTCMAHLANWTAHIQNARAISSTTGKILPIMITEWNYNANPTLSDGKAWFKTR